MKARRALVALAAAGALLLTGCGNGTGDQAAGAPASPATAPTGMTAPVETAAPADTKAPGTKVSADAGAGSYDFTTATLDGGRFDGRSLAGRPALLWFWAPWCPTCLQQARPVTELAARYQGRITTVGVAGLGEVPAMHDFVRMAKLKGFPQLADEQGVVWKRFKMTEQSTFVVLDRAGKIVARGHADVDKLPEVLDPLLAG
ncbi:thiol:disulfide interchange protein [Sphaerisporangium rufum]|uniref:Thiol:disulfide interchange protein n=1 Tax=Sphaerisporangium rufum TaxID=1381558 RepID=A0A919R304_9ACTN|nr:redoxin family protein [Sphaerisporangium rufum]GII77476.1 thiol:disulfide interchange protein [Sphaerisporangium rufum]